MEKIKISRYEDFRMEKWDPLTNEKGFKLYYNEYGDGTISMWLMLNEDNRIKIYMESNSNLKDIVNLLNCLGFNFEYKESVE